MRVEGFVFCGQLQDVHWSCRIVGYDLMIDHEEVIVDHNRHFHIVRRFPKLTISVLDHQGIAQRYNDKTPLLT